MTKGILLAGGSGTRLHPITQAVSKQCLPIYDKPMIYYPLATLMQMGITDILIISTPHDLPVIKRLLGDGTILGITLSYAVQERPEGIAQALIIAESFIAQQSCCLILGDNLFYGSTLHQHFSDIHTPQKGACIYAYHVHNPERYGVLGFDQAQNVISIEEKPTTAPSNWAVTGLYRYDHHVVDIAKTLRPSKRGELEITDINRHYLSQQQLHVEFFEQSTTWLDAGTPNALLKASQFIHTIEERQGLKIGCIEEIAYRKGYINQDALLQIATEYGDTDYSRYLAQIARGTSTYRTNGG